MEHVKVSLIKQFIRLFLLLIVTQLLWGQVMAKETVNTTNPKLDARRQAWETVARKTIFFGHQSVGNNIIDGLRMVAKQNQFQALNIIETRNGNDITGFMFAHSKVGRNKHPGSKIEDFAKIVRGGMGKRIDVALLKLCYVDIDGNTDTDELFQKYHSTLKHLQKSYPQMKFLAATVPLTTLQTGWKAWVKRILGRSPAGYRENIKRNKFNELARTAYAKRGLLFDIAKVESTLPDGSRSTYTVNNTRYLHLYSGYTSDGGHLNAVGKQRVAENLIQVLATIAQK